MSGEGNSKMSDTRVNAILGALEHGCTRRAAAGAGGITSATLYRWLEDEAFREAVEKAEQKAEATFTAIVAEASVTSWQAAAWWLERRKWQDYGRHDRVDVDVRKEAERLATELGDGTTAEQLIAEAERYVREGAKR